MIRDRHTMISIGVTIFAIAIVLGMILYYSMAR